MALPHDGGRVSKNKGLLVAPRNTCLFSENKKKQAKNGTTKKPFCLGIESETQ